MDLFEPSLIHTASPRATRDAQRDPVPNKLINSTGSPALLHIQDKQVPRSLGWVSNGRYGILLPH